LPKLQIKNKSDSSSGVPCFAKRKDEGKVCHHSPNIGQRVFSKNDSIYISSKGMYIFEDVDERETERERERERNVRKRGVCS
jgi:hypothetical protein